MRRTLARLLLGPWLLAQGRQVRAQALRLPEAAGLRNGLLVQGDEPESGDARSQTLRLCLVGDSSCAGVGLTWQYQALPYQTAHALHVRLRRSVHWRAVARTGIDAREALDLWRVHASASDAHALRAHAVVLVLGVNDVTAQRSGAEFAADVRALWEQVQADTGAAVGLCCAVPPMDRFPALPQPLRWYLGLCSRELDAALQQLCREVPGLHHAAADWSEPALPMAEDGYHPGLEQTERWGRALALRLAQCFGALSCGDGH